MIGLDEILLRLLPLLKAEGYRKQKLNWFRVSDGITTVFTIQKSRYSPDAWYYCFGVSINALHEKEVRSANQCEIQERFDSVIGSKVINAEDILQILRMWEQHFGSMDKLKSSAVQGKLPRQSSVYAIRYLTSNR